MFSFLVKIHHEWWLVLISLQSEGLNACSSLLFWCKSEQWVQIEETIVKVPVSFSCPGLIDHSLPPLFYEGGAKWGCPNSIVPSALITWDSAAEENVFSLTHCLH